MRWRITLTMALVFGAHCQAAEDNNDDGAGKNDDIGAVDRCDSISPYSKEQLKQHIQLNSMDLEKLKASIESRFASLVDKTLMDLQERISSLSEQRDKDRKMIVNLERTLSNNSKEIDELKKEISRNSGYDSAIEQQLTLINSDLAEVKTRALFRCAAKMVDAVTSSYPSSDISIYRKRDTVVVKRLGAYSFKAIIFGVKDITKFTVTVKKIKGYLYFMAGWSAQSRATKSMSSWFGEEGWKSAGPHSDGFRFFYPYNNQRSSIDFLNLESIGRSMTTTIDMKSKHFIFETNGSTYKTSFSAVNMSPESEEDPQFYPALTIYSPGSELIISDIECSI